MDNQNDIDQLKSAYNDIDHMAYNFLNTRTSMSALQDKYRELLIKYENLVEQHAQLMINHNILLNHKSNENS